MFREGSLKVRFKVGEHACNNLNANVLFSFFFFFFFFYLFWGTYISEATETPFVKCQEHGDLQQRKSVATVMNCEVNLKETTESWNVLNIFLYVD